jgi:hypothetical protein
MNKKLVFLVLIILLATTITFALSPLVDIKSHWAKTDIEMLVSDGIVNGYTDGTFMPNANIKRNEFIKLVATALKLDIAKGSGSWDEPYIKALEQIDILPSFESYNVSITREEMAQIITNALYFKDEITETAPTDIHEYIQMDVKDIASVEPKYTSGVINAFEKGLITGYSKKDVGHLYNYEFRPTGLATRAEAVTVIQRLRFESRRKAYVKSSNLPLIQVKNEPVNEIKTPSEKEVTIDARNENGTIISCDTVAIDQAVGSISDVEHVLNLLKNNKNTFDTEIVNSLYQFEQFYHYIYFEGFNSNLSYKDYIMGSFVVENRDDLDYIYSLRVSKYNRPLVNLEGGAYGKYFYDNSIDYIRPVFDFLYGGNITDEVLSKIYVGLTTDNDTVIYNEYTFNGRRTVIRYNHSSFTIEISNRE